MILFLLEQRYGHGRRRFFRAWRACPAERRQHILRMFCKRHLAQKIYSMYWLLVEVLKDGMPSKKDFLYIWGPAKGRYRDRMTLCWHLYVKQGCSVIRAINLVGGEAALEFRTSQDPKAPIFCY